jgi:hypothetical protein
VAEIPAKKLKRGREKKSWTEEFMAEIWPNVPKSGRKGAEEKFLKKFLFYSNDKHTEAMTIFHFHFKLWLQLNSALMFFVKLADLFPNWPNLFPNWPNFFDVLAGTISGPATLL